MRISRGSVRRGVASSIFLSLFALLAIVLLAARRDVLASWRRVSLPAVLAGAVAIVLVWLAKAGRMYAIAGAMGGRVPYRRFFAIYMTTCFISHITPFSAGGVPMQVYLVHRAGLTLGEATALTALDAGFNLLVLPVAVPLVFILGPAGFTYRVPRWFAWVGGILALLIMAGFLWRRTGKGASRAAGKALARWRQEYSSFRSGLRAVLKSGPSAVLIAAACTFAYWFFYLMLAPIILLGLGLKVPWSYMLGGQLIFNFLQVLVPTPGGSGGSELLLLGVFAPILRRGQAGVFVLLWKVYTFYSTLAIGGYEFWRLLRRLGRRSAIETDTGDKDGE